MFSGLLQLLAILRRNIGGHLSSVFVVSLPSQGLVQMFVSTCDLRMHICAYAYMYESQDESPVKCYLTAAVNVAAGALYWLAS